MSLLSRQCCSLRVLRPYVGGQLDRRSCRWLSVCFAALVSGAEKLLAQPEPSQVFPEDRLRELTEELDFTPPEPEPEPEEAPFDFSEWFDGLSWNTESWSIDLTDGATLAILLVLLAGIGFFIYRMLGDVSLRKRLAGEEDDTAGINIDDLEEERLVAEGVSLTLLERAERAGQYDVAVRLLYLQLLKELQDGGFIKYRRDYSNRDYQYQLRDTAWLADFRDVTADYERYWYGKYAIERLGYRLTRGKFTAFFKGLRATAKAEADVE
jgi:hypothetical protein